jgi:pimeloyl-ACP methyl ester carboxylesterase
MAKNEAHQEPDNGLSRRRFLAAGSMAALAGPSILGAGWPTVAGAAELPPVDNLPFWDEKLLEGTAGPRREFREQAAANYADFKRGTIQASGMNFAYVEIGEGPLALCVHGYPDSPFTWRYLMPELAKAGYRAVCYWNRGYFPSDGPTPRSPGDPPEAGEYHVRQLRDDVGNMRDALGGDKDAVLICHDWGALMGWGIGSHRPDAFRRIVIGNVPPLAVFAPMLFDYGQLNRSFYFWWLQMPYSSLVYKDTRGIVWGNQIDGYAFPAQLTEDWAPGYDGTEDAYHHKLCYEEGRRTEHVLGSYRNLFSPEIFAQPKGVTQQSDWWGEPVPGPVLYLHGTNDGCITLPERYKAMIPPFMPNPLSRIEMVQGTGHYFMVQRPQYVNKLILDFLAERP